MCTATHARCYSLGDGTSAVESQPYSASVLLHIMRNHAQPRARNKKMYWPNKPPVQSPQFLVAAAAAAIIATQINSYYSSIPFVNLNRKPNKHIVSISPTYISLFPYHRVTKKREILQKELSLPWYFRPRLRRVNPVLYQYRI